MVEPVTPYVLTEAARQSLLALAAESDLLLIGELHGTQEVPRLILGLMPHLSALGYGGLALEMPSHERDQFLRFAQGEDAPPPLFGPSDFRDGRGNAQALSLIGQTVRGGWDMLCFDVACILPGDAWSVRGAGMASNLEVQWGRHCPGKKVLGVCGNYHSRLVPPTEPSEFWPSFAHSFQELRPNLAVRSVNVTFGGGACFNGGARIVGDGPKPFVDEAEVRPTGWAGYTMDLYLPYATPATFVEPRAI